MPAVRNMRKKLDYLVRATGKAEADIVAEAVDEGLSELYRRQLGEAYLCGTVTRDKAVQELGADAIDELDYARESVTADVKWGLEVG